MIFPEDAHNALHADSICENQSIYALDICLTSIKQIASYTGFLDWHFCFHGQFSIFPVRENFEIAEAFLILFMTSSAQKCIVSIYGYYYYYYFNFCGSLIYLFYS